MIGNASCTNGAATVAALELRFVLQHSMASLYHPRHPSPNGVCVFVCLCVRVCTDARLFNMLSIREDHIYKVKPLCRWQYEVDVIPSMFIVQSKNVIQRTI